MADVPKGPPCPVCATNGRSMTMVLVIPETPPAGFGGDEQWTCRVCDHKEAVWSLKSCEDEGCDGWMRYTGNIVEPPIGAAGRGEHQRLPDPGGEDPGPGWECDTCGHFELDTAPPTETPATQD